LFGTKGDEKKKSEDDDSVGGSGLGKDKDGYETVNEGMTTDTTEAP
jgi:hypothetical protein